MIVAESTNEIMRGGEIGEERTLRIKASSKAFRILSDGLYSDKISAVIRELSTNAFDAHVQAGKSETPFDVNLPNGIDPNFRVRDYGNGITPENMDTIFTVYFESTKSDSNDFIGCMGLGCKSPLSYTDAFIVDTIVDGVKHTYSIYKNESGVPSCLHLSSIGTSEPSGVCIIVPVKQSDFNNFAQKAKTIYKYFTLKPNVSGNVITIPDFQYFIKTKLFGLRHKDWDGSKAIMGNVCYPLSDLFEDSLTENQRAVLGLDLNIHFNIGELDVSASREKLSYDKNTVKNICNKLDKVFNSIHEVIKTEVEKCSTLWEARNKYADLITKQNLSKVVYSDFKVEYKGVVLDYYAVELNTLKGKDNKNNFTCTEIFINRSKLSKCGSSAIKLDLKTAFIIDDIDSKKVNIRIKNLLSDNTNDINRVYLFKFDDISYEEKVLKHIGIEQFTKLSQVYAPEVERVSTGFYSASRNYTYNPKYNTKVFLYDASKNAYKDSDYWKSAEINEDDNVIYVSIERFKIDGCSPNTYIDKRMMILSEIGLEISNLKVYGIKKSSKVTSDKWIKLDDYVQDCVAKFIKDNEETFYSNYVINDYDMRNKIDPYDIRMNLEKIYRHNSNYKMVKGISSIISGKQFKDVYRIYSHLIEKDKTEYYFNKHKKNISDIYTKYPLIKIITGYKFDLHPFIEYVELIDMKHEKMLTSV